MVNKRLIAGILIFAGLAGAAGYKLFRPVPQGITATGTIEVTRADITPKVGGYLRDLKIQVGDSLTSGQVVVQVVRPDLAAQVLRDQAGVAKAQAQLADTIKGPRSQERQEAAANLAGAQAVYTKAKSDYERLSSLHDSGAIATQQLDAAKSAYDVAYNSLVAAQSRQSLIEEGNRPDVIAAQTLEVQQAEAVLASSQSLAADMIVVSPLNGLVLAKNYEEGEYVNPGAAIATIGDMNDCWVKIYVDSAQLGLIKVGQPTSVTVDAFPDRTFSAVIKEISQNAEFTPRQSITQRERANLVFAVKVKIDNAEGILKPGMPADVVLQ